MRTESSHNELLPHLFRQEYAKMTAVLCRHFGLHQIEIAEDIASETFLKASEQWALHGVPHNPQAWLYTVAKNKTKDHLKRLAIFENKIKNRVEQDQPQNTADFDNDHKTIADSQLAMIFAVCNPVNSDESQLCLALQILCGFSIEEIGNALLCKTETVKKRLLRARALLRKEGFQIQQLSARDIRSRLDIVLSTLYLLFNEGYYSKTSDQQIRVALCSEALRLALILIENPLTNTAQTNALLALLCFQSSRLAARTGQDGMPVLFDDQDRTQWDQQLIQRGNYFLVQATAGQQLSTYHLEAGIAYWHTTTADINKWKHILQLYNQLLLLAYTPVAALNRTFALSKVYGCAKALEEAVKLEMQDNIPYHQLMGYLYTTIDPDQALAHYRQALAKTTSQAAKHILLRQIGKLTEIKGSSAR